MARKRVSENPVVVSGGAAAVPARRKTAVRRSPRTPVEISNELQAEPSLGEVVAESAAAAPTPEQIAKLAYSLWLARGGQGGSPEEDWLRAEQQLTAPSAK